MLDSQPEGSRLDKIVDVYSNGSWVAALYQNWPGWIGVRFAAIAREVPWILL